MCAVVTLALLIVSGISGEVSCAAAAGDGIPWLGSPRISDSPVFPPNSLPLEPEEFDTREVEAYYDWRSDLFYRRFDLSGSGSVDFMTARRTYKVWLDEFGTPVVIANADPLFYWLDVNKNGEFEQSQGEMWSDPDEDGVTGNERPYDNSDLQRAPSEVPLWSPPDRSAR